MAPYAKALVGALAARATTSTLEDLCTVSNLVASLPSNGTFSGIEILSSLSTASVVSASNSTSSSSASGGGMGGAGGMGGGSSYSYCNATITYTHTGLNDTVYVKYAFPSPSDFKQRFYVGGGGGYQLNSDATGGLGYGAASGATGAGYDSFSYSLMDKVLIANGTVDYQAVDMFGYQALGEMTIIGKYITKSLYGMANDTKIYTYYEGCSDGGREGMSQVQRWGSEYDGVIAGAPAFRFAQQQVLHVFPSEVMQTLDYYPNSCALNAIVNATIAACDPLDGRTDGVISRTDLCKLNYNLTSTIGTAYNCDSSSGGGGMGGGGGSGGPPSRKQKRQSMGGSSSSTPAQNGTVNAQDVAVAQTIYDGLFNSQGERAYLAWQIGSSLSDASTTYDNTTGEYELSIPSTGGEYVTRFIELVNSTNLSDLDGVTYDTLVDWMNTGMYRYNTSLQTTYTDLSEFRNSGGKLLHYHGESDPSIPSASSVHYWQAIKDEYYGQNASAADLAKMAEWYQLYLVPGAGHCGTNSLQPGPYPEDNVNIMIDWVENGVQPNRLNATVSSGTYANETQMLCQFPTRPLWTNNTSFDCVTDEASIESWTYTFDAFNVTVP